MKSNGSKNGECFIMDEFQQKVANKINKALDDLREGKFILVYDKDGREEETDFLIPSILVKPHHIKEMRKTGGGLICTTFTHSAAEKIGLPYMTRVMDDVAHVFPILRKMKSQDLPYDELSAFSLTINHRETFTGITDNDRALTIERFARFLERTHHMDAGEAVENIGKEFRTPGHVHLLRCSEKLLAKRVGHTELATAMMEMAGLQPSATICEMMGDDGNALSKPDAQEFARRKGYLWLEGFEVIEAWELYKKVHGSDM